MTSGTENWSSTGKKYNQYDETTKEEVRQLSKL